MSEFTFYVLLLIIFALATLVPFGLGKLKKLAIPIVVGEILAGIIFGKSFLGILGNNESITFIADVGFAVLMFLSGLEVDLSLIKPDKSGVKKPIGEKPIVMGWLIFAGTMVLSLAISFGLIAMGMDADVIMLTLLLSTTSLGVVVPVLKEKGLLAGTYGQILLVSALIADVATMLLITIYISWCKTGNLLPCLLIAVIFLAFAIVVSLGKKAVKAKAVPMFRDGTGQIMVKISFFILFAFICLAEALGIETILGAFIAGLVISIISNQGSFQIREKMDIIGYGFFIPVFFINIGATFDISTVIHNKEAWLLIPVLLLVSFANKIIPVMFMKKNYSWRNTLAAGSLLSSRLSLIIAAGAIALNMGLISEVVNSSLLLVAIISCTVSPLLFNALYKNEAKGIEPAPIEEIAPVIQEEH